jgi:hypothetical protein
MNLKRAFPLVLTALAFGSATAALSAAVSKRPPPESDLVPREKREAAVTLAQKLAKVETPESLADAGLTQPFNPPGFGAEAPRPAEVAAPGPTRAVGDREILMALAPKVVPKGTLSLGSNQLLIFGKKNLRAGDRITVNYEGQDYSLELVSFDHINFTLRLNHEEITRPIRPDKPEPKKP